MKRLSRFLLAVLLLASFALCFGVSAGMAQDLVVVSPKTAKVLVENDQVRILEVMNKPGGVEPMHSHPNYVSVFLSATKIKITTADGKVVEKEVKPGVANYSGPVTHTVEVVGTGDFHVIVVELKK